MIRASYINIKFFCKVISISFIFLDNLFYQTGVAYINLLFAIDLQTVLLTSDEMPKVLAINILVEIINWLICCFFSKHDQLWFNMIETQFFSQTPIADSLQTIIDTLGCCVGSAGCQNQYIVFISKTPDYRVFSFNFSDHLTKRCENLVHIRILLPNFYSKTDKFYVLPLQ